jgi:hypothetical protein
MVGNVASNALWRSLRFDLQGPEFYEFSGRIYRVNHWSSAAARSPMDSTSDQSLAGPAELDATPRRDAAPVPA